MRRPARAVLTAVIVLAVCLTAPTETAAADPSGATSGSFLAPQDGTEALDVVEDLLDEDGGAEPVRPLETEDGPREATLALRDLALQRTSLSGAERAVADGYLARPTDRRGAPLGATYSVDEEAPLCGAAVCVHRVSSTGDQASPGYAQQVLATMQRVHRTYVRAGYRAPKPDGRLGGNAKTDIYLADLGDQGVYGYCTSDQSAPGRVHDRWAFCVLDNDYAPAQYPSQTPTENLKVTAAHEYFHAVQFGYDFAEDVYFMEATAVWAEDEVYDGIDDNVQFLRYGSMRLPGRPLDQDRGGLEVYGAWGFFRYLTERFPQQSPGSSAGMPTLVRTMWRRADSAGSAPDRYSLQAMADAVRGRRSTLRREFAGFSAANRNPARVYDEAGANSYPAARLSGRARLGRGATWTRRRSADHLTSHTFRMAPAAGLTGRRWRLRVAVDLPPAGRGSEAIVRVLRRNGSLGQTRLRLNRSGNRVVSRSFAVGTVKAVEVSLINASTRIRSCGVGTAISCAGRARDDRRPFEITARVIRR